MDVAVRAQFGAQEKAIQATLRLLNGALPFRLRAELLRDAQGKLFFRATLNKKEIKPKKKKPGKKWSLTAGARQLLVRHIRLESMGLSLTIGVAGDAAVTAKLCGLALAVLESAAGIVRILKPKARILMRSAPNYRKDCLNAIFSCIFSIKLGHIILIVCYLIIENTKGALTSWITRLRASCVPPWKTSRT